ncbi:MAG: hypothetical protein HY420_04650 [Candidatus Kerfeldbacteria bacterium]|nr:hypothetical protein [Candidatus Kerfeldbacteria bacterium]
MIFYVVGRREGESVIQIQDSNPEGTRIHGPFVTDEQAVEDFEPSPATDSGGRSRDRVCILFEGRLVERSKLPERIHSGTVAEG